MNTKSNAVNEFSPSEDLDYINELEKVKSLITTLKGQEEFLLDTDGIIISTNLEAVNVTGYEEYEVIGHHINLFYSQDEKSKVAEDLKKAFTQGSIAVTGPRVKKRGTVFWAKMKIKYISDENGRNFYKVILQDTTHRVISKIKMQAFRDEFLTIFNNPFVGTFKYRKQDGRILRFNQKILDITGSKESNCLYFSSFFNNSSQYAQFNSLLEKEKKIEGFQFLINNKTLGSWGLISANYFENQGLVGGVMLDISDQINRMTELERVNLELENFTYHASHDLRAPLTSIMGLVNLGLMDSSNDSAHQYFNMILNRINHLDTLLKDLVSISYNGKAEISYEPFDFKQEVESIIDTLKGPYSSTLDIESEIVQSFNFMTDPIRLRTILRNLLSNSFKYQNANNRSSRLKIKVRVMITHVSIQVQDNGIGIDHKYKEKVFDMFFRATTESSGSGLGLYIVKSMLTKLDGKISMESTLMNGTTFLLTIPNGNMKIL